jgi:hypothetical protein
LLLLMLLLMLMLLLLLLLLLLVSEPWTRRTVRTVCGPRARCLRRLTATESTSCSASNRTVSGSWTWFSVLDEYRDGHSSRRALRLKQNALIVVGYSLFCNIVTGPGSSGSIVTDYGIDDRAIQFRSPAEARGFFLQPLCPDQLWGPPSLLSSGYRGSSPQGVKRGRGVMLTTHPHLVPRSRMSRSYTSSPVAPP